MPSVSNAQTTLVDRDLDIRSAELKAGDKAPFDGHLLSNAALAKMITYYKSTIAKLEAEVSSQKKVCEAKLLSAVQSSSVESVACKYLLDNATQTCKQEKQILSDALTRNSKTCERKWYESPWIPLVGGVVICGGSVALGSMVVR